MIFEKLFEAPGRYPVKAFSRQLETGTKERPSSQSICHYTWGSGREKRVGRRQENASLQEGKQVERGGRGPKR